MRDYQQWRDSGDADPEAAGDDTARAAPDVILTNTAEFTRQEMVDIVAPLLTRIAALEGRVAALEEASGLDPSSLERGHP